jgi:hypothetical protein
VIGSHYPRTNDQSSEAPALAWGTDLVKMLASVRSDSKYLLKLACKGTPEEPSRIWKH